jgi:hypothetical protein
MWNGTSLYSFSALCLYLSNRPTIDHLRAIVCKTFDSRCYMDVDIRSVAHVCCRCARRQTFSPPSAQTAQRTACLSRADKQWQELKGTLPNACYCCAIGTRLEFGENTAPDFQKILSEGDEVLLCGQTDRRVGAHRYISSLLYERMQRYNRTSSLVYINNDFD